MDKLVSKESLIKQVDGLRDIARRSRRLAETMDAHEQRRLNKHAEDLEETAGRIEGEAASAKTGVMPLSKFPESKS